MTARVVFQSANINPIFASFGGNQYGIANKRKNTFVKLVYKKSIINFNLRTQLLAPSIGSSSNKPFNNNSVVKCYSSLDSDSPSTYVGRRRGIRCVAKAASPLEHFTETSSIKVVTTFAKDEARRMGHDYVDTGHILLGIIAEDTGIGAKVLKAMGINLIDARREVEKIIGRGKNIGVVDVEMRITRRAMRVLEISLEKARELGHNYVESEHLLLGLLHEGEVVAARVLQNLGADQNNIRTQLLEEVSELEKELKQIPKQKNEAIRDQDLEKAGKLSDREIDSEISKGKISKEGNLVPIATDIDVQHIVSSWTGIPDEKISSNGSNRFLEMEKSLHTMLMKMEEAIHVRLIGQDEAVKAISHAVCRERSVLKNPNRPIASFIFSGPTSVGKSELAKALASYCFGFEEAMILVDMSEFMERPIISKLRRQLTEAVCRQPYTVVLFDKIEMAHPDVFNMMLQIMEDGCLTDSYGHTVDFKNTILIMTSTVGSNSIQKGGYNEKDNSSSSSYNRIRSVVREELKQYFRPELLNQLDEIIVFRPLTKLELKDIAVEIVKEVSARLQEKGIIRSLDVTPCFIDMVVEQDYYASYGDIGKRSNLRRQIAWHMEERLAEKMLTREIQVGDAVTVHYDSRECLYGDVVFMTCSRNDCVVAFIFQISIFLCFFFLVLFVYWVVSRVFRL